MSRRSTSMFAVLAVLDVAAAAGASLAGNAATGEDRWPGLLDHLRRSPWTSFLVLVAISALAAVVVILRDGRSAEPEQNFLPQSPPPLPEWVIDRSQATGDIVKALCSRRAGRRAVGITASAGLYGAGGFGKSTLAAMVWADERTQQHFRGRIYQAVLGRDVRSPSAISAKVAEVTRFITGDSTEFEDPGMAGAHLGRLLDKGPPVLLIVDDVWWREQLDPFLRGGRRSPRLVTTRLPELLPADARGVEVDVMTSEQARRMLGFRLPCGLPEETTRGLLRATGHWPLLLRLANSLIYQRVTTGVEPAAAGAAVLEQLRQLGPTSLDEEGVDLNDSRQRQTAVGATIEAGTLLLGEGGYDRFAELAVFAEDETIPVDLIVALWTATSAMSEEQSRDLCASLAGLSLISLDPNGGGRVRLHDVIRDFLEGRLSAERLRTLHGALVDAAFPIPPVPPQSGTDVSSRAWWEMPDGYLADHLVTHLIGADRTQEAETLACDLRWIAWRLESRAAFAPIRDLDIVATPRARLAARELSRVTHLLAPTDPGYSQSAVLHSCLAESEMWRAAVATWRSSRPTLYIRWAPANSSSPELRRILTGHTGWVLSVDVAPDGTWIASADVDGIVRIWDVGTGEPTGRLMNHTDGVLSVTISKDGMWFATASRDSTVRIWSAITYQVRRTLGLANWGLNTAIAPDGTWLAVASGDRRVRMWSPVTGRIIDTVASYTDPAVAISPDGTRIVTCGAGRAWVWDVETGELIAAPRASYDMYSVAVAPGGQWFAASGSDGAVRTWNLSTGEATGTFTGHEGAVRAVAISPDGSWIASAGDDRTVRIWDVAAGHATAKLTGHTKLVRTVAISPDGSWIASAGDDKTVRIWDSSGPSDATSLSDVTGSRAVAASPDGAWLASAGDDGRVRIIDLTTGRVIRSLPDRTGRVRAMAVIGDSTRLVILDDDRTVRVCDAATGRVRARLGGHSVAVRAMALSADATRIATVDSTRILIRDMASGRIVQTLWQFPSSARALAIAPDGTWLVVAAGTGVHIRDIASGRKVRALTGSGPVRALAISPDGRWITAAGTDGTVRIWDTVSGCGWQPLAGRLETVLTLAISPDGRWIAAAGADGTVRIWKIASGQTMAMMRVEGGARGCCWLPDGQGLAVAGERGPYVFDFQPSGRQVLGTDLENSRSLHQQYSWGRR